MSVDPCGSAGDRHDFQKDFLSPAADPQAPYARIAVAGLVRRKGGDGDPPPGYSFTEPNPSMLGTPGAHGVRRRPLLRGCSRGF